MHNLRNTLIEIQRSVSFIQIECICCCCHCMQCEYFTLNCEFIRLTYVNQMNHSKNGTMSNEKCVQRPSRFRCILAQVMNLLLLFRFEFFQLVFVQLQSSLNFVFLFGIFFPLRKSNKDTGFVSVEHIITWLKLTSKFYCFYVFFVVCGGNCEKSPIVWFGTHYIILYTLLWYILKVL